MLRFIPVLLLAIKQLINCFLTHYNNVVMQGPQPLGCGPLPGLELLRTRPWKWHASMRMCKHLHLSKWLVSMCTCAPFVCHVLMPASCANGAVCACLAITLTEHSPPHHHWPSKPEGLGNSVVIDSKEFWLPNTCEA